MRREMLKCIENPEYIKRLKRNFDTNIFKFTNHESEENSYFILVKKNKYK